MTILIVDDEPLAQDILEAYIRKVPGLQLAGRCSNALEAFSFLSSHSADLLLLDINMPEISGMDFLRMLPKPPLVVFTTAYSSYALAGYEVNAVDYLVKPIPFDRFLSAVQKARERLRPATPGAAQDTGVFFVRTEGKLVQVAPATLWLIEGLKDYVRLWTDSGRVIVHSTMKGLEEQLAGKGAFVRVSKSYIVNLTFISEVDGHVIRIKDQAITIGSTYRDAVHEVLNRYRLR